MFSWRTLIDGRRLDCYDPEFFEWLADKEDNHELLRSLDELVMTNQQSLSVAQELVEVR